MKRRKNSQYGFTLLEMAGVLLVSSILASMGAPMINDMQNDSEGEALQSQFAESLLNARQHAVSTGNRVSICASEDGESCKAGAWSKGWLVYQGLRIEDGVAVGLLNVIDSKTIENEEIDVSVFDEELKEVADIRFNEQGFNLAKQKISTEMCVSDKELFSNSVFIERSGRIRVSPRVDQNTILQSSCSQV